MALAFWVSALHLSRNYLKETLAGYLWAESIPTSVISHPVNHTIRASEISWDLESKRRRKFHQIFFSRMRKQVVSKKNRENQERTKMNLNDHGDSNDRYSLSFICSSALTITEQKQLNNVSTDFKALIRRTCTKGSKKNLYLMSSFLSANNYSFQACTLSKSLSNKETTYFRSFHPTSLGKRKLGALHRNYLASTKSCRRQWPMFKRHFEGLRTVWQCLFWRKEGESSFEIQHCPSQRMQMQRITRRSELLHKTRWRIRHKNPRPQSAATFKN